MLMVTTSTSTNNTDHYHQHDHLLQGDLDENDNFFYDNLKKELDSLSRDPSDDVINNILAYAKTK
jgi:hypothetical protein